MRIGLFIPCFIDAFFPEVGVATLELLEGRSMDRENVRELIFISVVVIVQSHVGSTAFTFT